MRKQFFPYFLFLAVCIGRGYESDAQPSLHEGLSTEFAACRYYLYNQIHSDSAQWYARLAEINAEGKQPAYGYAILLQAEIRGRLLADVNGMEDLCLRVIADLSDQDYPELLSWAHCLLAFTRILQSKYEDASHHIDSALILARLEGSASLIGWAHAVNGFKYAKTGQYWEAFTHLDQGIGIGRSQQDTMLTAFSLAFVARLFNHSGSPRTAIQYYQEFLALPPTKVLLLWPHVEDLGYAYLQLGKYDSASYYRQYQELLITNITQDSQVRNIAFNRLQTHFMYEVSLGRKEYEMVLQEIESHMNTSMQRGHLYDRLNNLDLAARAAQGMGDDRKLYRYASELLHLSQNSVILKYQKTASELLTTYFEKQGQTDSAYHYYRLYVTTRDTMDESVFSLRAAHYLLSRDTKNTIRQLHQENKEQVRSRNIMLAWMLLLVLTGMIGYRSIQLRRKNEKLKFESKTAALQKKALELEMQALRSQMNPHFIFNCLNAIDNLVQKGEGEKATIYLSRFARLIRLVMEISRKNLIPFHQDMEAMRLYLKLEQFRCQNAFDFFIEIDDNLTHGDYEVPPLIIQPFIENAIHHGLLNKAGGDRVLTIQVQFKDDHIKYHIKDNGIGRAKAIELRQLNNPGHQSYGIGITRERLQLHNKETSGEDVYIMDMDSDKNHPGTCVIVRILIDP